MGKKIDYGWIAKNETTYFAFIDESVCEEINIASLIALLIPENKMNLILEDFYKIIKKIIDTFPQEKEGSHLLYHTPVLHANSLLKDKSKDNPSVDLSNITDNFRINIFEEIIQIVEKHKLLVIRVGYNNLNEFKKRKVYSRNLYQLNWMGISSYLDKVELFEKVICIMDGTNLEMVNILSSWIYDSKGMTYFYPFMQKSMAISTPNKFLGNVFYTPSKYCEYLQIVDIVAYVLHKKDFKSITNKSNDFIDQIVALSPRIEKHCLANTLVRMNFGF
ncbi:MAG: DUF3800 domain-containing protein [Bacteroidales bacterium]